MVQEESANQLGQVLAAICGPRLKLDVVSIPDADAGTADSLRHIKDKIQVRSGVHCDYTRTEQSGPHPYTDPLPYPHPLHLQPFILHPTDLPTDRKVNYLSLT